MRHALVISFAPLALLAWASGCSKVSGRPGPGSAVDASVLAANPSAIPSGEGPNVSTKTGGKVDRSAPPVVDDRGCIVDTAAHGAQLILARHGVEIGERLGRPPGLSDLADRHCASSAMLEDLDGDGAEDSEVTEGCSWGTSAQLHLVYFSNRGCRTFAGELVDGELLPLSSKSRGMRDLEATWSNGCAGNDFAWRHYRWDGKAYAVYDEAICHLCAETPPPVGANRHPHCRKELADRQRKN